MFTNQKFMHIILNIEGISSSRCLGGFMGKYIKCPRCELNWILAENEYCDVCKAELGMEGFTLLEDEDDEMLCPVCGINYIDRGEKMCADCKTKQQGETDIYESDTVTSENEMEDDIEKISFDEIEEEEKFDMYDDAFDDQDDFSANDFDKDDFSNDEEDEEEIEEVKDDFEDDFNYNIDDVDTSDIDDEDEEDADDEDEL